MSPTFPISTKDFELWTEGRTKAVHGLLRPYPALAEPDAEFFLVFVYEVGDSIYCVWARRRAPMAAIGEQG
jgi:hypothetical protein